MCTVCRLNSDRFLTLSLLMLISILICACGGGEESSAPEPQPNVPQADRWERFDVIRLGGEGADNPNVQAIVDSQGLVHIFYYKRGDIYDDHVRYQVYHAVWDTATNALIGEEGARHGPSIMPGGSKDAWPHVKPVFQSIAAKVGPDNDIPCCEWIGSGGAGHYVKMIHNGIEYGDMQLICEAYSLLREGLGLGNDERRGHSDRCRDRFGTIFFNQQFDHRPSDTTTPAMLAYAYLPDDKSVGNTRINETDTKADHLISHDRHGARVRMEMA